MSFVANPFVVVLDANVLFPFRTRDVLFTFAHEGLFRARLSDEILDDQLVLFVLVCRIQQQGNLLFWQLLYYASKI